MSWSRTFCMTLKKLSNEEVKTEVESYREKIFKAKEKYHKELSKLPFDEKVKILKKMWRIAREVEKSKE